MIAPRPGVPILSRIDAAIAELYAIRAELATVDSPAAGHALLVSLPGPERSSKIEVIKAVRRLTGLGLREAKDGTEDITPGRPMSLGYRTEADLNELRALGCEIELRAVSP